MTTKDQEFQLEQIGRYLQEFIREFGKGMLELRASQKQEVKNKLSKRMVDEFMEKKLPRFKELIPEYRDSRILGGIGALVVKDDVGRYAEKAGLYVLTQTSDGGAALLNRKGFTPREFL